MAFKFSEQLLNSPKYSAISRSWSGIELRVSREDISNSTIWNIKENSHRAIVHLSGNINKLETELNGCGNLLEPPMAGELWLVPSEMKYSSKAIGDVVQYAEIIFQSRNFENFITEIELKPQVGYFDKFLYQNVLYLSELIDKNDDVSKLLGENLSRTIGLHILKTYNADTKRKTINDQKSRFDTKWEKIIQSYIFDNLEQQITLAKLADLVGVSTHNFLELFSRSFGTTPAQFIIKHRLRKVRQMLVNTKKDITTIAFETGFSSHSHLTSTFKKKLAITPQDFRSLH